jgi:hypothetical protein
VKATLLKRTKRSLLSSRRRRFKFPQSRRHI